MDDEELYDEELEPEAYDLWDPVHDTWVDKLEIPRTYVALGRYSIWNILGIQFHRVELNPEHAHDANDCSIRAVYTLLYGTAKQNPELYRRVYQEIATIGAERCVIMNHTRIIAEFMERYGYTAIYPSPPVTLATFLRTHRFGKYLVHIDSHMFAYIDGTVIDSAENFETDTYMMGHPVSTIICKKDDVDDLF
jgi:hypothetical protein